MKDIYTYILESQSDIKFSKATVAAIKKNLLGMTVKFEVKDWKFNKVEVYKDSKSKYIKIKFVAKSKGDNTVICDDLIMVFNDKLKIGKINLENSEFESKLVSTDYDEKKNVTHLKYELRGLRFNSGFDHLYGNIILNIPSDIMNAKETYEVDCNKYDKFMKDYLPKKEEYLSQIKVDELLFWSTMMENNEVFITLQLEVGKGYGDNHKRTSKYNFKWDNWSYKCDRILADKNREAQIVRKFIYGLEQFLEENKSNNPEIVHIIVNQELD